jgi:hypothetical protein
LGPQAFRRVLDPYCHTAASAFVLVKQVKLLRPQKSLAFRRVLDPTAASAFVLWY